MKVRNRKILLVDTYIYVIIAEVEGCSGREHKKLLHLLGVNAELHVNIIIFSGLGGGVGKVMVQEIFVGFSRGWFRAERVPFGGDRYLWFVWTGHGVKLPGHRYVWSVLTGHRTQLAECRYIMFVWTGYGTNLAECRYIRSVWTGHGTKLAECRYIWSVLTGHGTKLAGCRYIWSVLTGHRTQPRFHGTHGAPKFLS